MGWLVIGVGACVLAGVVAILHTRRPWPADMSPWPAAAIVAYPVWVLLLWRASALYHESLGPRDAELEPTVWPYIVAALPLALMSAGPACSTLAVYLPRFAGPSAPPPARVWAWLQALTCLAGAAFAALVFWGTATTTARVEGDRVRLGGWYSPTWPRDAHFWCQDAAELHLMTRCCGRTPTCTATFSDGVALRFDGDRTGRAFLGRLSARSGRAVAEVPTVGVGGPAPMMTPWAWAAFGLVAAAGVASLARTWLRPAHEPFWLDALPLAWLATMFALALGWWAVLTALFAVHFASIPQGDCLILPPYPAPLCFVALIVAAATTNSVVAVGVGALRVFFRWTGRMVLHIDGPVSDEDPRIPLLVIKSLGFTACLLLMASCPGYSRIDPDRAVFVGASAEFRTREYHFQNVVRVERDWLPPGKHTGWRERWVVVFRDGFEWTFHSDPEPAKELSKRSGVPIRYVPKPR